MVDSQRAGTKNEFNTLIWEVTANLARKHEGYTHVLEVASYFPLDIDTISRLLEALEQQGGKRVQKGSLCYFQLGDDAPFAKNTLELEQGKYMEQSPAFRRVLSTLKSEEDWVKKVREQHEILRIAAGAKHRTLDLSYLTSRCDIPSAKIQSILNDFGAEGYIDIAFDDDGASLRYTFPEFEYPKSRFQQNMAILSELDTRSGLSWPLGIFVVLAAIVLLAIVIFVRFYA